MIVARRAAAEGDARALGDQGLGLFTKALVHEVTAVDHRCSHRLVTDARSCARGPGFAGVDAELLGGAFAKKLHRVAAFDHRDALGDRALEFDRAYFAAVLLALERALCQLILVEFALNPFAGPVENIDDAPEQILEIGLDAGIDEAARQGVEDVGDGAPGKSVARERPGVGLVVIGPMAVKLHLDRKSTRLNSS